MHAASGEVFTFYEMRCFNFHGKYKRQCGETPHEDDGRVTIHMQHTYHGSRTTKPAATIKITDKCAHTRGGSYQEPSMYIASSYGIRTCLGWSALQSRWLMPLVSTIQAPSSANCGDQEWLEPMHRTFGMGLWVRTCA